MRQCYLVIIYLAIRKITPDGTVSTFAGTYTIPVASKVGVIGFADGNGTTVASFNYPWGITADSAGNLYVTDNGNNTIRKITPAGIVSTIAGKAGSTGSADGGGVARFNYPTGIVADSSANIYVADYYNHAIRKVTPSGIVTTVVGVVGQGGFITGSVPGVITFPLALTLNGSSLYIAMSNGVAVVKRLEVKDILAAIQVIVEKSPRALLRVGEFSVPKMTSADIKAILEIVAKDGSLQRAGWLRAEEAPLSAAGQVSRRYLAQQLHGMSWSTSPWDFFCETWCKNICRSLCL